MILRELFFSHIAQTSETPIGLEIIRAAGCELEDATGKKYLDLISGIAVSNLGHHHPAIVEAIKQQTEKYLHLMVYGELIESPQVLLAKELTDLLPPSLSSIYYVNSGTEAVEGALKLARKFTGRIELVTFENAYHGSTFGALSVNGNEEFKNAYRPLLPGIHILKYNSFDDLGSITEQTAAVIVEPIQAEAGIILPENNFLVHLRKRCNETGALLIFDESQTAMGRTGEMFEFQNHGIIPDILILAKAFGGGMPLGAFISSKEIMGAFSIPALGHLTTFGGHPVSCASALAALNIIKEKSFLKQVKEKEKLFRKNLHLSDIKEVRGKGLFLSLQFEDESTCKSVINECIERGLLVDWFLFAGDCMRIAPPLIISEEEIERACDIINKA